MRVVVEQLLNEVDVREQHPAAAVPREPELVQRLHLRHLRPIHQVEVRLPLVPDHLAAREAAHRDDHGLVSMVRRKSELHVRVADSSARHGKNVCDNEGQERRRTSESSVARLDTLENVTPQFPNEGIL